MLFTLFVVKQVVQGCYGTSITKDIETHHDVVLSNLL